MASGVGITEQAPSEKRLRASAVSPTKRGNGKVALADPPPVNVGGAGAYDPFTVAAPATVPAGRTHTGKSAFSWSSCRFLYSTSQTAAALPLETGSSTAGMPSSVAVTAAAANGALSLWISRVTTPPLAATGFPFTKATRFALTKTRAQ